MSCESRLASVPAKVGHWSLTRLTAGVREDWEDVWLDTRAYGFQRWKSGVKSICEISGSEREIYGKP